jgi:hypothetical protein
MTQGTNQREQQYVSGLCPICGETDVLLYAHNGILVCAYDYRTLVRNVKWTQACDKCGAPKAVRDPAHRRNEYLCISCHNENGILEVKTTVFKRALVALTNALPNTQPKVQCYLHNYGTECDDNIKPRGAWGGKSLCSTHGKTPPKPEKATKS